jgi:GNAT superfamily N-acetyltransferase
MTDPHLRRAIASDGAALQDLQASSMRGVAAAHYSGVQVEAFLRRIGPELPELLKRARVWVLTQDRTLVASAAWHPDGVVTPHGRETTPEPGAVTVRTVFVHPGWVRRGLAARLVRHVEAEAAAHGAEMVKLDAMHGSESFYRALGYRDVGPATYDFDGVAFPGVAMAKPLTSGERLTA